jgi:RNA polymerase sigma-70 factor (ECF subfamily)
MTSPRRLSDADDHDLVASTLRGHEEAFGELVRRYRGSVVSAIGHLVHDDDLAEDLAQETFIRAYEALGTFRAGSRFAPWILKIANNAALDHVKKEQRLRRKGLDTVPLEPTPVNSAPRRRPPVRPHVSLPSDATPTRPDPKEARRALEEAIAKLRGHYRRCTYLREIEGLSYDHIAQITGLPIGSVSTYINRGRKQVRNMLAARQEPRDDTPSPIA